MMKGTPGQLSGSPPAQQKDRLVGSTIALVDDDRNILTSVSMTLEAEGFTVRCYADGAEALKAIQQQPVDLAILDIKMPRMDGRERARDPARRSPAQIGRAHV